MPPHTLIAYGHHEDIAMPLSDFFRPAGRWADSSPRVKRRCRPDLTRLEPRTVMNVDLVSIAANPASLWPPNGRFVPVTISGVIADDDGVDIAARFRVRDEYG